MPPDKMPQRLFVGLSTFETTSAISQDRISMDRLYMKIDNGINEARLHQMSGQQIYTAVSYIFWAMTKKISLNNWKPPRDDRRYVVCDIELWLIKNFFCAFLARVKSYTHTKKLNMSIYWFWSESGYRCRRRRRRRRRQRRTREYNHLCNCVYMCMVDQIQHCWHHWCWSQILICPPIPIHCHKPLYTYQPLLGRVHTYTSTSKSPSARVRENMKSKAYLCEAFTQRRVLHESELRAIPTRTSSICTSRVFRQLVRVLFTLRHLIRHM